MAIIAIEYTINNDGIYCGQCGNFNDDSEHSGAKYSIYCSLFEEPLTKGTVTGKILRCQTCLECEMEDDDE